ncbi:trypsin-like serine protease [Actinoplanes rectilineatus]|uniref:trypsin-like serine protease n=1 Tax=Actinoplanes rectilineatus TaxID=113571 RepID=UPI0006972F5F|nr:trypsin-like serine protease [Actinoplanes rectilineatus]
MTGIQRVHRRLAFVMAVTVGMIAAAAVPASAITGGETLTAGQYSFTAQLRTTGTDRGCTAVLVHPQAVLTDAACVAGADGVVSAGAPKLPTTITVGRADLTATTTGFVTQAARIIPHPTRPLALVELAARTSIAPVTVSRTAPVAGERLVLAGYGRTADQWVPDVLKSGAATVGAVAAGTVTTTGGVGVCKGDAGGPVLRQGTSTVELVGLHHASNQAGCLAEAATGTPEATGTRVDDLYTWVNGNVPSLGSTFEAGDHQPHYRNSTGAGLGGGHGGVANVTGITTTAAVPELFLGTDSRSHSGTQMLLYSGKDTSTTSSYAFLRAFTYGNVMLRAGSVLSYWVYPQSKANSFDLAEGDNSMCVAMDLIFTDGSTLRDSGLTDQDGHGIHPANQCGTMTLDTWNEVRVEVGGRFAGKVLRTVMVGYQQAANTGGFRGFIDDYKITDVVATDKFSTGLGTGETQPTWTNTLAGGVSPRGGAANIGGVASTVTVPELFVGTDHLGTGAGNILLYSGKDNSATSSYAYLKSFGLAQTFGGPTTKLHYRVYPQSKTNSYNLADGNNSKCVAIDLIFHDRTTDTLSNLRSSTAPASNGKRPHPAEQCTALTLDKWNDVTVDLGSLANGKEIVEIDFGYDQPANTGGYRGFVDDIRISF